MRLFGKPKSGFGGRNKFPTEVKVLPGLMKAVGAGFRALLACLFEFMADEKLFLWLAEVFSEARKPFTTLEK